MIETLRDTIALVPFPQEYVIAALIGAILGTGWYLANAQGFRRLTYVMIGATMIWLVVAVVASLAA